MTNSLPALVLNKIFRFLSVKERIKCEQVCLEWQKQIKAFDAERDSLMLHLGCYRPNKRWSWTNQQALVRVENTFEIDSIELLQDALNILELKNLKKVKLVNSSGIVSRCVLSEIHVYLAQFVDCEELEIEEFSLGPCVIQMPRL